MAIKIKKTANGNIIYSDDTPLVVFKGTTCALTKSRIKFFDVPPEMIKHIVEIALKTINEPTRSSEKVFGMIDDISYRFKFRYTYGAYIESSLMKFDSEFW